MLLDRTITYILPKSSYYTFPGHVIVLHNFEINLPSKVNGIKLLFSLTSKAINYLKNVLCTFILQMKSNPSCRNF